ncbi:MAG: adenosine deaminase [Thermodesulfobacteriota bacterium]
MIESFIHNIPKAELHVHIEGTLEPEMMIKLAAKNGMELPFESGTDIRKAYDFKNLQSFLDIYYKGLDVLVTEDDFYDLTWTYLQKASEQNIRHAEISFDPQAHTARGLEFETVVKGIHRAMLDTERRLGLSSKLIMCILRHLSVAEAMDTLEMARAFKNIITAVGLDSSELGHPPEKFVSVFNRARRWGLKTVAHAGEEGPPDYIWQALKLLRVERIDHGVRCLEDTGLVEYLARKQVPLTVCPMSNVKLKVFDHMKQHNLKKMMASGLCVTINSDDPAYFGGYIEENFLSLQQAHGLNMDDISKLVRNAFKASFLNQVDKRKYLNELDEFVSTV